MHPIYIYIYISKSPAGNPATVPGQFSPSFSSCVCNVSTFLLDLKAGSHRVFYRFLESFLCFVVSKWSLWRARAPILEAQGLPEASLESLGVPIGTRVRLLMNFGGFWHPFGGPRGSPRGTIWVHFRRFGDQNGHLEGIKKKVMLPTTSESAPCGSHTVNTICFEGLTGFDCDRFGSPLGSIWDHFWSHLGTCGHHFMVF